MEICSEALWDCSLRYDETNSVGLSLRSGALFGPVGFGSHYPPPSDSARGSSGLTQGDPSEGLLASPNEDGGAN